MKLGLRKINRNEGGIQLKKCPICGRLNDKTMKYKTLKEFKAELLNYLESTRHITFEGERIAKALIEYIEELISVKVINRNEYVEEEI